MQALQHYPSTCLKQMNVFWILKHNLDKKAFLWYFLKPKPQHPEFKQVERWENNTYSQNSVTGSHLVVFSVATVYATVVIVSLSLDTTLDAILE